MRVTIIPEDGIVGVDRVFRTVDLSGVDRNIHAIQWDSVKRRGEIEYKDRSPNKIIKTFTEFKPLVTAWRQAFVPPPDPPIPPTISAVIDSEVATPNRSVMGALIHALADELGITVNQLVSKIKAKAQ